MKNNVPKHPNISSTSQMQTFPPIAPVDTLTMMPSVYGAVEPGILAPGYQPEYTTDEWPRQVIAASNSRRFSRGSTGQRPGANMRITKPTSASNSPRSSVLASRRRTVVNEGMGMQSRIRQQFMDQALMSAAIPDNDHPSFSSTARQTCRPVSWHPGTQIQQHYQFQQYQSQCPGPQMPELTPAASPACYPSGPLSSYSRHSPVPIAYSCQASPVAFSPLPPPFSDYQQSPQCAPNGGWVSSAPQPIPMPAVTSQPVAPLGGSYAPLTVPSASLPSNDVDWNVFAAHGFNMSPQTPECFPPAPPAEPALSSEESIPFKPLEEEEEEDGEILVGMGLYDTPGKDVADTGLDNYRTTTSHLLGTATGKGLKLLEAWEPPASDDEDEGQDDDLEDGVKVAGNA